MNKFGKILFLAWVVLALASFICAFFTPIAAIKVLNLVFGGLNILTILSWVIATIQGKMEYNRQKSGE